MTGARSALVALWAFVLWIPGLAAQAPAADAASLYQAGNWDAARAAYRAVVADEPDNGLAWLRLARTEMELGAPDAALDALDRADAADFASPFVAVFRARAFALLDRPDDAFEALATVQDSPALGGRRGLEAIADLDRLAADPRWEEVLTAAEGAAYPCRTDPRARDFDFWIGEWAVFANGQRAGTNRVEVILEQCVLLENWTNVQGRQGKSFNWVDRSTDDEPRWRQLWVDDSGNTLDYVDGAFTEGAMRFSGTTVGPQGDTVLQKLTFVPVHADTVRQVFEQSTDGGASWQTTWVGLYVRLDDPETGGAPPPLR